MITVPAFKCLWSSEDNFAGHFRRYRLKQLSSLLEKNGFSVCYQSYFFSFLFLPILFVRVWGERLGFFKRAGERSEIEQAKIAKSQHTNKKGLVALILKVFERIETKLMPHVPFGSSVIVVARKV